MPQSHELHEVLSRSKQYGVGPTRAFSFGNAEDELRDLREASDQRRQRPERSPVVG
jgi:hypothetical protein